MVLHLGHQRFLVFLILLHPDFQFLYSSEEENPILKEKQYTWIVLPQSFRSRFHLCARSLEKVLRKLKELNGVHSGIWKTN